MTTGSISIDDIPNGVRARFVKDYSLPIQLVQSPYFEYFLDLYSDYLHINHGLNFLKDALSVMDEQKFFAANNKLRENVVNDIKSTHLYGLMNDKAFYWMQNLTIPNRKLYIEENHNKKFISIDMTQANFNSFLYYQKYYAETYAKNLTIFRGHTLYTEYLREFTDVLYFLDSKYVRQVIFGNLNPKRQQKIQAHIMMVDVYEKIKHLFNEDQFTTASSDEIIIECNSDMVECIHKLRGLIDTHRFHVQGFTLKQIEEGHLFFVREFLDRHIDFKMVPLHFHAQCFKRYHGLPIEEMDKAFYFEKRVAKFTEDVFCTNKEKSK